MTREDVKMLTQMEVTLHKAMEEWIIPHPHKVPLKPPSKCYCTGSLALATLHYKWSTLSELYRLNVKNAS